MGEDKISNSWVTDRKAETKRIAAITFAAWAGATGYIVMIFIAMPFAVHLIVNEKDGCNPKIETDCFIASSKSEEFLVLTLTALRLTTFAAGSLVGVLSDRYGRKPLLLGAVVGYLLTGVLFSIGWSAKEESFFIIGAIVLGASSPINPHAIAYVSDISTPDRLARNMGMIQGFGYFFGLMSGAVVSLILGSITLGEQETTGDAGPEKYSDLFYAAFGFGIGLSAISLVVLIIGLPESLSQEDRKPFDWRKANPFGFANYLVRNPYMTLLFTVGILSWASVGASEVVTGGWWLRRYAISDLNEFITFIVAVWIVSAFGAVFCTIVYQKYLGLKKALHLSFFFTTVSGVAFSLAPDYIFSYATIALVFFGTSVIPISLALIMGQVDSTEKGSLAGAIRSAEALSKTIGIVVFGLIFSEYLKPFTPDISCVPATYTGSGDANTCECGVESCPNIDNTSTPFFFPSECSTGQLSLSVRGKSSKFINNDKLINEDPVYPQFFVDEAYKGTQPYASFPGAIRSDDCKGPGLVTGTKGLATTTPRQWCVSEAISEATFPGVADLFGSAWVNLNELLGCPGLDILSAETDTFLFFNQICVNGDPLAGAIGVQTGCGFLAQNGLSNNTVLANATSTEEGFRALVNNKFDPFNSVAPGAFGPANIPEILARIQNLPEQDADEICNDFANVERGEINVCVEGPIADFPGIIPFIYGGVVPFIAWMIFVAAELLFKEQDGKYWSDTADTLAEVAAVEDFDQKI